MSIKKIISISLVASLLAGCAITSTRSRTFEERFIHKNLNLYGAYKARIQKVLKADLNGRCDENLFVMNARLYNNVHNVVDVVMNETCVSEQGMQPTCRCEYTGIGIIYEEIDVNEIPNSNEIQKPSEPENQNALTTTESTESTNGRLFDAGHR